MIYSLCSSTLYRFLWYK